LQTLCKRCNDDKSNYEDRGRTRHYEKCDGPCRCTCKTGHCGPGGGCRDDSYGRGAP
jgi:hypothetical protein